MAQSVEHESNEIHNFKQLPGESLMEAWYRIQEIATKSTCRYAPHTILTRFHDGLDTWSKLFVDRLAYGRFATGNPHFANTIMINLFGNPRKTREETEFQLLKESLNKTIVNLNEVISSTTKIGDIKEMSANVN